MTASHISYPRLCFRHFLRLSLLLAVLVFPLVSAFPYTVILDAGHGGKDHGAIDNDVREKDINLGVALKVQALLSKKKDIKVVMTRSKDEYLTLQQRADVANKAGGDLFVSIHTNSVAETNPNRTSVAGASTYTLGTHKDGANMDVARRENSVMTYESGYEGRYQGFDPNSDESYIIFEMAQKSNMAQSLKFAADVQKKMSKVAGRRDRGVHQAGFWVLWATSMPSALIELDFICNPNSAKYLASQQGQDKLAQAIAEAIEEYFASLADHEKARLRTERTEDKDTDSIQADAVLAAATPEEKKLTEAPGMAQPAERTRRPAQRRRRSEAAREKSERQEYAEAVIPESHEYTVQEDSPAPASDEPVLAASTPAQEKKDKKKRNAPAAKDAKKQARKERMASHSAPSGGRQVVTVNGKPIEALAATSTPAGKTQQPSASAKPEKKEAKPSPKGAKTAAQAQVHAGAKARMAKVNTVYKIRLFSADELLKEKDPRLGGLSHVTYQPNRQGGFSYFYGESQSQSEMVRLLADVQKVFPEATVVSCRRN